MSRTRVMKVPDDFQPSDLEEVLKLVKTDAELHVFEAQRLTRKLRWLGYSDAKDARRAAQAIVEEHYDEIFNNIPWLVKGELIKALTVVERAYGEAYGEIPGQHDL